VPVLLDPAPRGVPRIEIHVFGVVASNGVSRVDTDHLVRLGQVPNERSGVAGEVG
jgi:hypothetical protein